MVNLFLTLFPNRDLFLNPVLKIATHLAMNILVVPLGGLHASTMDKKLFLLRFIVKSSSRLRSFKYLSPSRFLKVGTYAFTTPLPSLRNLKSSVVSELLN